MRKYWMVLLLSGASHLYAQMPELVALEKLPLQAIPDCDADTELWIAQALQAVNNDQTEQASLFLQQAEMLDFGCVQVAMAQAWVQYLSGERQAGFQHMNELLSTYGPWPELVGMQITLMLSWAETGPWWKKEGSFTTYLGRNPEFPGVDSVTFTQHWLTQISRGFQFLQSKGYAPASQQLIGFSRLQMKSKQWDLAIQSLQWAARDSIYSLDAYLSLAQCAYAKGQTTASLAYLDSALLLNPENPVIYQLQANLLQQLGDARFQEAEARAWFYQHAPLGCLVQPDLSMIHFLRNHIPEVIRKPENAARKWQTQTGKPLAFLLYWTLFLEPSPPPASWKWLHLASPDHVLLLQEWCASTLMASEEREAHFAFYAERIRQFQPDWFAHFLKERLQPGDAFSLHPASFQRYGEVAMAHFPEDFLMFLLPVYGRYPIPFQLVVKDWVKTLRASVQQGLLQKLQWKAFPFDI